MQDCARLSALFGWSIEAIKGRWRQLNPNRWQASPGKPKPKARNLGFGLAAARIGAPKVAAKQNKCVKPRAVLSAEDKDAILIRTVRMATSTACPVNWKHLSTLYECDVNEIKSYNLRMNIAERVREIILARVRGCNAPLCDKQWCAVNLELGIENAAELWEEIAVRKSVCRDCGWQPCTCVGTVQAESANTITAEPTEEMTEAAASPTQSACSDVKNVEVASVCERFVDTIEPCIIDLTDD